MSITEETEVMLREDLDRCDKAIKSRFDELVRYKPTDEAFSQAAYEHEFWRNSVINQLVKIEMMKPPKPIFIPANTEI